jgi:hypothetical protein
MARINTQSEARRLNDIHAAWRVVARQTPGHAWQWTLPNKDVSAFQSRRDRLEIATVQRRDQGEIVLLARTSMTYRG